MKIPMLFTTQKAAIPMHGDISYWVGRAIRGRTATSEEVAAAVAEKLRLSPSDVKYIYTKTGEIVREIIIGGRNVNLDWVAFTVSLIGSFEKRDSPFTAGRNMLMVRAHSRTGLRDCLANVTPRNVTDGLKAAILSVMDNVAMEECVLTVPSKVLVAGNNILIDSTHDDEGVSLLSKNGDVVATPTILSNDASTLDLDFGELPPDGSYTLVVKARTGASMDFAPAVARRNVTVRKAN